MPPLRPATIRRHLAAADAAATAQEKGDAWEELCVHVLSAVPGFTVHLRKARHVLGQLEIDIVFWNDQVAHGFKSLPDTIFVEARNWTTRVGAAEVRDFVGKMRQQGVRFGVLIAANGVTGDAADRTAAHGAIGAALQEERRVIVINRAEIEQLGNSADLVTLIKRKICELVGQGDTLPVA
jgi:hypothetical protein